MARTGLELRPGEKILVARKQMQLTLRDLEEKTGISIAMLSRYERGTHRMSVDVVERLSAALDLDPSYLVGWAGPTRVSLQAPFFQPGAQIGRLPDRPRPSTNGVPHAA